MRPPLPPGFAGRRLSKIRSCSVIVGLPSGPALREIPDCCRVRGYVRLETGLAPAFTTGWTVRRMATSVEPSKTSRTSSQTRQRNSPLVPFLETSSTRR
jgi:hypothetical protein